MPPKKPSDKILKNLFYKIALIFFCIYWAITIFFILPKNPLNINAQKSGEYFQVNFFQRWSFFAPPPTYNQRVYFVFKNKITNAKIVYEIVSPILEKKHHKAPFNSYYQQMDYIIASSLINIEGNLRLLQDVFNHEYKDSSNIKKLSADVISERLVNDIEKTTDFNTLKNYVIVVAENNNINLDDNEYQIQITKINIPKYADRFIRKAAEEIVFSSHFFNF